MGKIYVDDHAFEVNTIARKRGEPGYILKVSVGNRSDVDIDRGDLSVVLPVGGRSQLTDDLLEQHVREWAEDHPDADIIGFGVVEEWTPRYGERTR